MRPNLLNQFSVNFNRLYIPLKNPNADGNYPMKAGLTGLPPEESCVCHLSPVWIGTSSKPLYMINIAAPPSTNQIRPPS